MGLLERLLMADPVDQSTSVKYSQLQPTLVNYSQLQSTPVKFLGPTEKWSECLLDLPGPLDDMSSCFLGVF